MNWITNVLQLTLAKIIDPSKTSVVWFMSWKCHEKSTPLTRKPTTNNGNVVLRWYSFYFYIWSHSLQQSFFFTLWFCSLLLYSGLLQVVSLRISERCHWKCAASRLSNYPAFTHRDIWRSTQQSTIVGNINHGLDADWLTVSIVAASSHTPTIGPV